MIQFHDSPMDSHKSCSSMALSSQKQGFTVVEVLVALILISLSLAAYQTFTLINTRQIILNDGRYRAAVMAANTIEYLMSGSCNSRSGAEVHREITLEWKGYQSSSDYGDDSASTHSEVSNKDKVQTFKVLTTIEGIGMLKRSASTDAQNSPREMETYQMARWCSV